MKRIGNLMRHAATALVLAALLAPPLTGAAQTGVPTPAKPAAPAAKTGGNKALMEAWVARKRQVRDQVQEALRQAGKLPENGLVRIEAVVRPEPGNTGRYEVKVLSATVSPASRPAPAARPGGDSAATGPGKAPAPETVALALTPIDISAHVQADVLDVPVSQKVTDDVVVSGGRMAP